jgi:hypothetical protein
MAVRNARQPTYSLIISLHFSPVVTPQRRLLCAQIVHEAVDGVSFSHIVPGDEDPYVITWRAPKAHQLYFTATSRLDGQFVKQLARLQVEHVRRRLSLGPEELLISFMTLKTIDSDKIGSCD